MNFCIFQFCFDLTYNCMRKPKLTVQVVRANVAIVPGARCINPHPVGSTEDQTVFPSIIGKFTSLPITEIPICTIDPAPRVGCSSQGKFKVCSF